MKLVRFFSPLLLIQFVLFCSSVNGADHLDAPSLEGNGHLDINDLYVFQSPINPSNTVLIMTVNPFAGVLSDTVFGTHDFEYEFLIDNTGDAMADISYGATFFANPQGGQNLVLTRNDVSLAFGAAGRELTLDGGGKVQAGLFDDPFFFDLAGFNDGLNFTGDDTLAGANVSGIVLEVPSADLGGPNIGVWARTMSQHHQVDRMGRPAINTVLIPSERKDEFNITEPHEDLATFGDDVFAAIMGLSDEANATALTSVLLPDVLTFDTTNASGFLNGRQLADDVIDAELALLTGGAVTGDGVDANDIAFRSAFPYLAPAHIPEPSHGLLTAFAVLTLFLVRNKARTSNLNPNHR